MRVLVTGADGFVARHLVPHLVASGHAVVGTALDPRQGSFTNVPMRALDVRRADQCQEVVRAIAPTHIVHLAAVSSVHWSFTHPEETRQVNVEGTGHLLAAARDGGVARVLVVGSAEEYGINDGHPLPELPLTALRPLSPYAESKVEAERLIEADPRFLGCTIRTRSFPHVGPGQHEGFFVSDVAAQLAKIAAGVTPPVVHVGNVDVVRDYTDVRDVARAYAQLLEYGTLGEVYNVCTGKGVMIKDILQQLISLTGVPVRVERDAARLRTSEVHTLVGDNTKLRRATGWEPAIPLASTLRALFAEWRQAVVAA